MGLGTPLVPVEHKRLIHTLALLFKGGFYFAVVASARILKGMKERGETIASVVARSKFLVAKSKSWSYMSNDKIVISWFSVDKMNDYSWNIL